VTAGGGGGGSNFLAWVNNSEDGIAVDNEIDSSGNVYVAASLLGNGLATLLKLTSSGALTSAQTIGNPFGTQFSSKAVRIDPTGNIYWCCQNNSASVIQIFKFDTSGSLLWEYEYQVNASSTYVEDMAMDSSGNIYVCGHDGGFGIAFFIKIDSTGAVALFESYIPGAGGRASGIAIDSTGAIILAGDAFDAGSGWRATNVVKYDAAGLYQWGAVFTGIGTNENKAVSVDTSGNIFAFGDSSTLGRFLLVMLDSSGSVLYSTEIEPTPGLTSVYGTGVATSVLGDVYALGTFNTGSQGCLTLMKFDSTLTNVWANSFVETSNYNESRRLRITGLQNLYVSGDLYLTSAGFAGPFQAKVSGSGTGTGTYNVGGETVDYSTQTISTAPLSLTYSSATYPGAGVSYLSTATSVTITTPTYTGANLAI
jgi:streptogramin lyase